MDCIYAYSTKIVLAGEPRFPPHPPPFITKTVLVSIIRYKINFIIEKHKNKIPLKGGGCGGNLGSPALKQSDQNLKNPHPFL